MSRQFDDTLKIVGEATQVLTVYWHSDKAKGQLELTRERKNISEKIFWLSADHNCKVVMSNQDKLWLYNDVCNDTGQNIPSVQLHDLWPELQSKAVEVYEVHTN